MLQGTASLRAPWCTSTHSFINTYNKIIITFEFHTHRALHPSCRKKQNLSNIIYRSNYLLYGFNTTEADRKVDERTEQRKKRRGETKRLYEGDSSDKRPSHDVFKELWQIPWICCVDYKFTQTQQHSDPQTHFFRPPTFITHLSAAAQLKRKEPQLR